MFVVWVDQDAAGWRWRGNSMFDARPIVNCVEREKVGNNTTLQAGP